MSGVELAACPFCGSHGEELGRFCDPSEGHDNSGPSRRIQCYGCHIEAPFYDTESEAIAAWNRRAVPMEAVAWREKALDFGSEGRCVIYAGDPLYEAFKPSKAAVAEIERLETANAQALAVLSEMMSRHVTNWPAPKRFGTAVSLIDKALHQALAVIPQGAEANQEDGG